MILETTCRGGLPCLVEMAYEPPDPSVGYFYGYWEFQNIQTRHGKYADWIKPTKADFARFEVEAEEQAQLDGEAVQAAKEDYYEGRRNYRSDMLLLRQ